MFGAFAGWQTAALKAYRKPLLWPWPWGACWGSGLGPGVPVGEGVWNFGGVWSVCGLANGSFESPRKVIAVALALGCLLGKLFKGKGLEGLEGFDGLNGLNCAATKGFIQFRTCSGPTGQVPHLRWSQAPPRPWRRPGSADIKRLHRMAPLYARNVISFEKYCCTRHI